MSAHDLAIDGAFAAFGEDITVSPGPSQRVCRAIRKAPDRLNDAFGTPVASRSLILEIRAADLQAIATGTTLTVAGASYRVQAPALYRDALRKVATIEAVPV